MAALLTPNYIFQRKGKRKKVPVQRLICEPGDEKPQKAVHAASASKCKQPPATAPSANGVAAAFHHTPTILPTSQSSASGGAAPSRSWEQLNEQERHANRESINYYAAAASASAWVMSRPCCLQPPLPVGKSAESQVNTGERKPLAPLKGNLNSIKHNWVSWRDEGGNIVMAERVQPTSRKGTAHFGAPAFASYFNGGAGC